MAKVWTGDSCRGSRHGVHGATIWGATRLAADRGGKRCCRLFRWRSRRCRCFARLGQPRHTHDCVLLFIGDCAGSSLVCGRTASEGESRTSRSTQQPAALAVAGIAANSVVRFAADAFLRRLWVSWTLGSKRARMNIFKKQVTSPDVDSAFIIIVAIGCLVFAAVPPYGHRAACFSAGAAVNFFNYWRLRRKIAAAKDSESHSDS